MKIGLVLEGGGLRGLYTAGVLDVMLDEKIDVDGTIGVSAGALFGPNYYSKQKGRALRYSKRFLNDKRYMSKRNFLLTGNYISKKFAYYTVPQKLDVFDNDTFMSYGKPFWAVCTNVYSGCSEYLKIDNVFEDMEALRASSAIPLSSKMIKVGESKYLDGGVSDAIPYEKMFDLGFDKLIIILTREDGYQKKDINPKKAKFVKFKYRKYPNLINTILSWPKRYNECLEKIKKLEKEGKVFVLRPSSHLDIALLEKDVTKLDYAYDMGVNDMKKSLSKLKKYLKG